MTSLHGTQLLAAVAFLAATLVLAVQLINPTPVQVSIANDGSQVVELSNQFQYREVGIIAVSACLLGASGMYLAVSTHRRQTEPVAVTHSYSSPLADGTENSADSTNPSLPTAEEIVESHREQVDGITNGLSDNEEEVYTLVLDSNGEVQQRKITEDTTLSEATVSRTLDTLETKGLVERKRRGMGNVVVLRELAAYK
ncbi:helix-turn-helix transcriptional regulator [Natrialba chahannaoensis]|uniref:helix-turn-helix transcriptional regulator n=1 Tax=Natrialba chahannaoensis TaxID=68911 RepID=UPI000A009AF6|nr:helix-turn-helix domain-containing protein [Natrialba chahannaoensis]